MAAAVYPVSRRTALGMRALAVAALVLVVCGVTFACLEARADEDPPLPHPIWTLVPTHIDPTKEKHIRLPPKQDETNDLIIVPDRPIRIGTEGTFNVDGKPTQIFGIVLPDRQLLCQTPGGARWACGVRAQAAFVGLLLARALSCERVSPLGTTVTLVSCKSGNDDVAERMLFDGWAEADKNASVKLKSIEEAARQALRGRWRMTVPEF
jgi:endonuclease YncB( thermonuclease family)